MYNKNVHRSSVMGCSDSQVADVRQVLRLLPVFCASAAYFCLYNAQMGNLYVQQVISCQVCPLATRHP